MKLREGRLTFKRQANIMNWFPQQELNRNKIYELMFISVNKSYKRNALKKFLTHTFLLREPRRNKELRPGVCALKII